MPLTAGADGHANPHMGGLMLVHLRFCELAALMNKFSTTGDCAPLVLQWSNIAESLRKCNGMLLHVRGSIWEGRVISVGHLRILDCERRPTILAWASEAKAELAKLKVEQKLNTKVAYDRWVDHQLRLGAGALHQITKRIAPPIEDAVYIHPPKSLETVAREEVAAIKIQEGPIRREAMRRLNLRPCQNCPTPDSHAGPACGDCGAKYGAVRCCHSCKKEGLVERQCHECEGRTSLAFSPNSVRCICAAPPVKEPWCTQCGGKTFLSCSSWGCAF